MVNKHLEELCGLIRVINTTEIGKQIAEDNLKDWCSEITDRMYICAVELSEDLCRGRERGV